MCAAQVEAKKKVLRDLIVQSVCFRNLRGSNASSSSSPLRPRQGVAAPAPDAGIPLPFIVVNTSQSTVINCEMGSDRTDVFFNFSKPFEINDDFEILKRMGMGTCDDGGVRECVGEEVYEYAMREGLLEGVVE